MSKQPVLSEKFEVLDSRPAGGVRRGPDAHPLCVAIRATATNAGAVRFNLNGAPYNRVRGRLFAHMKLNGLRLHLRRQADGSFIAWADPRLEVSK